MKCTALALLVLVAIVTAAPIGTLAYSSADPPIAAVQSANIAKLATMNVLAGSGWFENCNITSSGSLMDSARIMGSGSATVKYFAFFPSVDDRITADYPPLAYWAFGQGLGTAQWSTTNCDYTAEPSGSWTSRLTFYFMNKTYMVEQPASRPTQLPSQLQADLASTDGISRLNSTLSSRLVVEYRIKQCCIGSPDCSTKYETATIDCSDATSYIVEGGAVSRFLANPVVKEQWHVENNYNNIVVAKRAFYKGEMRVNNESFGYFRIVGFKVYQDAYGIQRIYTNPVGNYSNTQVKEILDNQSHEWALLPDQGLFSTMYSINSSYAGLGWNYLDLEIYDYFGQRFNYSDEILSRKLSYSGGLSEDALPTAPEALRPSIPWEGGAYKLTDVAVVGGLFGLLLMAIMLKMRK